MSTNDAVQAQIFPGVPTLESVDVLDCRTKAHAATGPRDQLLVERPNGSTHWVPPERVEF